MNITPHINPLPVATAVNPPTDLLRQENAHRPVITAPTQTSGSPAEKSTADKHKASGQTGQHFDFTELQKSAEKSANQINGNAGEGDPESHQEDQQDNSQEASANKSDERKPENSQEKLEAIQDEKEIQQLKQRDQEVRAHELAHAAVGGASTGSPSYEFQTGPDGKKYAVGGEVSVDLSAVDGDPQATIKKMQQVYAAALAPADPSAQDLKVAAQASELIAQAQAELAQQSSDESQGNGLSSEASPYIGNRDVFRDEKSSEAQSQLFDEQINQTLKAQEEIAPSLANLASDVKARAERIEGYYLNISQAYEKPSSHQFEITA